MTEAPPETALWSPASASLAGWSTSAAPGSRARLALDSGPGGAALRLDVALVGAGAWAIARREVALALPAHYVVVLRLRGEGGPHELQLKLVDPSGANVWWWRLRGFAPSREGASLVLRRANLAFAWGPAGGGEPERIGAVEVALAASHGWRGTLWIDALRVEPRQPASGPPRAEQLRASSHAPGREPQRVPEGGEGAVWQPAPGDPQPWLELDFGALREWGGLAVDFDGAVAPACRLLASEDGERFVPLAEDGGGVPGRRWLRTQAESRVARLELAEALRGGLARVAIVPIELAAAPERFAAARARAAPRGLYPRHLLGEGGCWAVVGADGDERKALLGEEGALEVDAESFTLEPFLLAEGRLLGWADFETRASLADGCLPIPSVAWQGAGLRLRITAFADGAPGQSALVARYALENPGGAERAVRLVLAIRPFQVTPAWQSLNLQGGVASIERLERVGARVRVNGVREVSAVSQPDGFAAAPSEEGLRALLEARIPARERVYDPLGFAEGAFAFELRLAPGASESVVVAVPFHAATPPPPAGLARAEAAAWAAARLEAVSERWRERLSRVPLALPACAAPFEASLRASLAWILVNREGPRIQPGPRAYRRSWIRDGALTATALAEMGFADEARAFLRWYAPHQLADGRVPCAVDRRGVDLVPEHDSHGQLAWGVVEIWRATGDRDFLRELWPRVLRAVDAIAALRAERTGEAFRGEPAYGLLPESISHEGYSSRPVHSYWDDFFAVCGLAAAAEAAQALGDAAAAARVGALRDAMRSDLCASIAKTMARHRIDFVPGSVELGDFDPTSTAIAFDPCAEDARLPRAALEQTFERYWQELAARRRGEQRPEAYTPYEVRNATALLRLGWKARALELLEGLIADQRPPGWRQWPEVAHRDPRAPRFLGDLPHGWVASSFVRAVRRLIAWEREDGVLVVAAGVPEAWVREAPGVRARGLATRFGPLDLELVARGEDCVAATLGGACRPPGGILLESPLARPLRTVVVGGRARSPDDPARVLLRELPVEVELRY